MTWPVLASGRLLSMSVSVVMWRRLPAHVPRGHVATSGCSVLMSRRCFLLTRVRVWPPAAVLSCVNPSLNLFDSSPELTVDKKCIFVDANWSKYKAGLDVPEFHDTLEAFQDYNSSVINKEGLDLATAGCNVSINYIIFLTM